MHITYSCKDNALKTWHYEKIINNPGPNTLEISKRIAITTIYLGKYEFNDYTKK